MRGSQGECRITSLKDKQLQDLDGAVVLQLPHVTNFAVLNLLSSEGGDLKEVAGEGVR